MTKSQKAGAAHAGRSRCQRVLGLGGLGLGWTATTLLALGEVVRSEMDALKSAKDCSSVSEGGSRADVPFVVGVA